MRRERLRRERRPIGEAIAARTREIKTDAPFGPPTFGDMAAWPNARRGFAEPGAADRVRSRRWPRRGDAPASDDRAHVRGLVTFRAGA